MLDQFSRTALVIKDENQNKLFKKRVAVFGIGGVGSYVAEALARSGVGIIDLIDNDTICLTNLNRQLVALHSTLGQYKVEVMKKRILDINPNCIVNVHQKFYLPKNRAEFPFSEYDFVVDAIDTVTSKLDIALACQSENIKLISCMGTGNKMDPSKLIIDDISKTSICPLARVMRSECKKRDIKKLTVVYSSEKPIKLDVERLEAYIDNSTKQQDNNATSRRSIPGSTPFVPCCAGLLIASYVIKELIA